ncbi:MAG: DUF4349 domain-containing protein [Bacteroidota bacterium]
MKSIHTFALLFLLFALFSCQTQTHSDRVYAPGSEASLMNEVADTPADEQRGTLVIGRKLIKEGNLRFRTDDLEKSRQTIFAAIQIHGGYVASDQSHKSGSEISNTIVIRVPAARFDSLLADATQGVSSFDSKNLNVRDVTEEFLDISARLTTKKELESRYRVLLQRSNSVSEILEVEKQIGELRAEIESIEGRLNYLQNRISFSTLTINVYEKSATETSFGHEFVEGFGNGWDNLIWFLVGLVNVWPFMLLAVIAVGVFRYYRRKA